MDETAITTPVSKRANRDDAIRAFLAEFAPGGDQAVLADMMTTICRLAGDGCDRGDLKLLNHTAKELRYAFKVFAPYNHIRKVSIFGSARTPEDHPEYKQAAEFARRMGENAWMVITGAGDGIMGAGHGGAGREASFGVAIRLPFEQETNVVIANDAKLVNFKYFFTRKVIFLKEAEAIALFPGGYGTLDEGFEALTMIQTGKAPIVPIVMLDAPGGTYWQHWRTYVMAELLRTEMIDPEDMSLFKITDNVDAAIEEILGFYRRFHSSRYVRDTLVLRLTESLSAGKIEQLNNKFADLLISGKIEQSSSPIAGEADEHPRLPRLVLNFDRKRHGRLRQMINAINAD
jgi:hypothetical protein